MQAATGVRGALAAAVLGTALGAPVTARAADGLHATPAETWPVLQARVNLMLSRADAGRAVTLRQAAVLGDVYLERHGGHPDARWRGGFRATSGLVFGAIGASVSAVERDGSPSLLIVREEGVTVERDVWPYVGFGYSGLTPRGGWGFSADLGIALRQGAAAAELGRALVGLRGWEGTLRRLDAMPMLQLGLRYRF